MKNGCSVINIYVGLILITLLTAGGLAANFLGTLPQAHSAGETDVSVIASTTTISVPIITYHIIRPSYDSDTPDITQYASTPEMFDAELTYLDTEHFHVVSLSDVIDYLEKGIPLPTKPVVITLDDGWQSQYQYAFPLLKKHNDTATFFVFTNAIGNPHYFSWDELEEMQAAGMTIGSHSKSHPYLATIQDDTLLHDEIFTSKQILEQHLGSPVEFFAYPFGDYTDHIIDLLKQAGYRAARSEDYGVLQSNSNLFTLKTINANGDFNLFVHALNQ